MLLAAFEAVLKASRNCWFEQKRVTVETQLAGFRQMRLGSAK